MVAGQVIEEFNKLRKDVAAKAVTLKSEEDEFKRAVSATADARATFEAMGWIDGGI